MVNGISMNEKQKVFNGMECLAAQLVAHFKDGPGSFYLKPIDFEADYFQEFEYHIRADSVTVYDGAFSEGHATFFGNWKEFANWVGVDETAEGPVNLPFVNDEVSRDWLKGILHESEVEVTFTKKDGTERVLRCTLNEDVVPPTGDKLHNVNRNESAQPVYDIENNAWRSFRWDSVKSVAFGV
jgi:hypothetical protein